ncbi:MAG TPA: S8 family serine peptidase [Microlunatus sp.]
MRPIPLALATAVATIVSLAGVSTPASQGAEPAPLAAAKPAAAKAEKSVVVPGRYIVLTQGPALASYRGGVNGIPRTKPTAGHQINVRSDASRRYRAHLNRQHRSVLTKAGLPVRAKVHDYSVAFNGFSAKLSKGQAAKLAQTPGVLRVWPVEMRTTDTVSTPTFLGLEGSNGVWQQQFGGNANAGRGIIIADLDSGIWPENPSFAPLESTPDQAVIDEKWNGVCQAGVEEPIACNNKLIGARYYGATFGNNISLDFDSPRDTNGHGSHTASTAAGNHGVPVIVRGMPLGDASGMAPAARIAAYKVLWENAAGQASGSTDGIVAAIDDAVADGADVITYSISGSTTFVVTPDELAFLGAADAGVFVSTSAGNSGDTVGTSSVAHNSPWEITVAASTHDRGANKTVTLGNGASYNGLGYGPAVPSSPLVLATNAAVTGANPTEADLCFSEDWAEHVVLDPAKVAGKIVVCTRGTNDRVDKSKAVLAAGGVGMVLADASPATSPTADFHSVPSIHVNSVDGAAIKTYAAGASPTASISAMDTSPVEAPTMAGFSSYGPAVAGGGDLLKPDITAPGVSVIAAVAPPGNDGLDFNAYDGTSMSTPHISGIAAMIKQKHPTWSPMWIKSALMTTATTLTNRGNPIKRGANTATPLDYGSGHVRPAQAFSPGLVYDSSYVDWLAYGCAIGQIQLVTPAGFCNQLPAIDPSDFNSPSIAVASLAGSQTVTRTFTNTSPDQASQYKPTVQAPPGTTVKVSTSKVTVPPLQSRSFSLRITRTDAPLNQWTFGSITWTDKRGHSVRSPIAVRPVALAVPSSVTGNGTSGSRTMTVNPGYTGTLNTSVDGLVAAAVATRNTPKPTNTTVDVTIPAGTTYARFATYDADYPAGTDIDLVVQRLTATGTVAVGSSGGATSEEAVNVNSPVAGTYRVTIDYFAGATDTLDVKLNSFALDGTPKGNLTVTPASTSVTTGTPVSLTAAWTGLTAGTRYLGAVNYSDGTAALGRTLVNVLP